MIPSDVSTVDADGVALAAIQGLARRIHERDEQVDDLQGELAARDDRIAALETANETLRGRLATFEERLTRMEEHGRAPAPADD